MSTTSTTDPLQDPSGHAVAVFKVYEYARKAVELLAAVGFEAEKIGLFQGSADADRVDDSHKWFADTDDDIRVYKTKLENGQTVVSVPIENSQELQQAEETFTSLNADMMTHFGKWMTVSKDLS